MRAFLFFIVVILLFDSLDGWMDGSVSLYYIRGT